jgi:hypothetical protein
MTPISSSLRRTPRLAAVSSRAWRQAYGPHFKDADPSSTDHALSIPQPFPFPVNIDREKNKPRDARCSETQGWKLNGRFREERSGG